MIIVTNSPGETGRKLNEYSQVRTTGAGSGMGSGDGEKWMDCRCNLEVCSRGERVAGATE